MIQNRRQAQAEANRRWRSRAREDRASVGDRFGNIVIRQKKVPERYEVGYWQITTLADDSTDGNARYQAVTLGVGRTWDEAFARASEEPKEPKC